MEGRWFADVVASLRSYRRPGSRKLSQQARTDIAGGGKSKSGTVFDGNHRQYL